METLELYQKISGIKPDYRKLTLPFLKPSIRKVQFNMKELDLHYYEEFGIYIDAEKYKKLGGGTTQPLQKKILVVELDMST